LLLQVRPDLVKLMFGQRFVQQSAPDDEALHGICIERAPGGVRRQHRSLASVQMGGASGPAPCGGIVGDAGMYRIEFDVALAVST